jgi:hypothetical protein
VLKEGALRLAWTEAVGRVMAEVIPNRSAANILIFNSFFIIFSFNLPLLV